MYRHEAWSVYIYILAKSFRVQPQLVNCPSSWTSCTKKCMRISIFCNAHLRVTTNMLPQADGKLWDCGKMLATILRFSRRAQTSGDRGDYSYSSSLHIHTHSQLHIHIPPSASPTPSPWQAYSLSSSPSPHISPRPKPRLSHRAGPTACHPNGGANYCSGFMTLRQTATFLGRNPCSRISGGRLRSRPRGKR